ncbi:spermidine synthase [Nocardioides sp. URHA0020]|uniref:spermidine synthase n=1 Tax=Nocardioides sp. URHA0020 TaxID=1380392 RepID=UPI0004913656|nr:fused MFS/spermidine synthase [Nocardioides sp. URHA0020]
MEACEIAPGDRPGTFVLRMSGMDQSYVDLEDPTRIVFDYVRRLADVVDAVAPAGEPVRVVHVGGAGMTLPRYVATTRPRSAQIVLEPATAVTELVRRELPLPRNSGIKVRDLDGSTGIAGLRDGQAELVVVDAFADARVPGSLVTVTFAEDLLRVVGPTGVVAFNLTDRAPFGWTRRAVASIRLSFPSLLLTAEPATLRAKRLGNLVVVASASAAALPLDALRTRATTAAAPYRVLDARAVSDGFGGGTPFTDLDAEPSPAP